MGSKGSQTVQQNQTYSPDPAAKAAITDAMGRAQQVSQTPFSTPVAPVAGFSNDQQSGFDIMRGAVGAATPYLQQAANYFTPQGISQFFNPMASNVMAGMKDIFGNQMKQTTGNLIGQAGGVGADRIAVGQSELARQQDLAAGQTLSGLYSQAASQAQGAGYGMGSIGPAIQNMIQQSAQGVLGTGGLQQQLAQAQANAPYQNILQQIAWPYQNSQFLTQGIAALAPGMGGTTNGQTTYPGASPWGTIAGLGMTGLGAFGGAGGFSGLGNMAGGYNWDGSMSGNQWVNAGQGAGPYAASARGGRINGYAEGGAADQNPDDLGGTMSTSPMEGAGGSLIPMGQITPIQPNIPKLPEIKQQGSGGGKGSDLGSALKTGAQLAMMFANRGGAVNGYAGGGSVDMGPLQSLIQRVQQLPTMGQRTASQSPQQGNPFGGLMSAFGNGAPSTQGVLSMMMQHPQGPGSALQAARGGMGLGSGFKGGGQHMADGGAPDYELPGSMADVSRGVPGYHDISQEAEVPRGLMRPESPDLAGPTARAIPRMLAPNMTSLAMGEPEAAPPQIEGMDPGKSKSFEDERLMGAVPEAAGLAAMATPAGAARGVARGIAPALAGEVGAGANVGRNVLAGTAAGTASAALSGEAGAADETAIIDPAEGLINAIDTKIKDAQKARAAAVAKRWDRDDARDKQKRDQAVGDIDRDLEDLRKRRGELERGMLDRKTTTAAEQAKKDQTFRENHPMLSGAFLGAGLGVSGLLPIGTKMLRAGMNNQFVKDWDHAASMAEKALQSGDRAGAKLWVKQLEGFEKQWGKVPEPKAGFTSWATGVAAPTEAAMLPEHLDMMFGTEKAKEKSLKTMLDPIRVPSALATGLTLSSISSKIPVKQRLGASEAARGYGATRMEQELQHADIAAAEKKAATALKAAETRARRNEIKEMGMIEAAKPKRTRKPKEEKAYGGAAGNPYFAAGGFAQGGFDDNFDAAFSPDFDQRWAPVDEAVDVGRGPGGFDPVGENGGYWSDQSKQQRTADNVIPLPRPRPDEAPAGDVSPPPPSGPEPRVSPSPEPSPAAPQGGRGNIFSNFAGGTRGGFLDSPWAALMSAGLGTMAAAGHRDSRGLPMSPWAAIGQGGMQGMQMMQKQRENAQKQQTIDQGALRLQQQLELGRLQKNIPRIIGYHPLTMKPIYGIADQNGQLVDPVTRKPIDMNNLPGGPVGPTNADPGATPPTAQPAQFTFGSEDGKQQQTINYGPEQGTNPEVLQGLDPKLSAIVRAVSDGRQKLSSVPFAMRPAVQQLLHVYNPNFDEGTAAARQKLWGDLATGNTGKLLMATNQLLPHIKTLSDLTQAMNNKDWQFINRVTNATRTQLGLPEVTNFETAREVVAMDAARLLRGVGAMAQHDIEAWRQNFSNAMSPTQLNSAINLLADDLMSARVSSIEQQWRWLMKREAPDFLSREAKDALQVIKSRAPGHAGQPPAGAPQGVKQAPDGKWYMPDPTRPGKYLEWRQ